MFCTSNDKYCSGTVKHTRFIYAQWLWMCTVTGLYACKQGRNIPCLVYVSFSHKIYVYWRVELECMEPTSLGRVLEERPEYTELLRKLGMGEEVCVCVCVYITWPMLISVNNYLPD